LIPYTKSSSSSGERECSTGLPWRLILRHRGGSSRSSTTAETRDLCNHGSNLISRQTRLHQRLNKFDLVLKLGIHGSACHRRRWSREAACRVTGSWGNRRELTTLYRWRNLERQSRWVHSLRAARLRCLRWKERQAGEGLVRCRWHSITSRRCQRSKRRRHTRWKSWSSHIRITLCCCGGLGLRNVGQRCHDIGGYGATGGRLR